MEAKTLELLLLKVGGQYKLATLFQKRMRELVRGLPPLVEAEGGDFWDIVAREILDGKVELAIGEEAEALRREMAAREAEAIPAMENRAGGEEKSEKSEKASKSAAAEGKSAG